MVVLPSVIYYSSNTNILFIRLFMFAKKKKAPMSFPAFLYGIIPCVGLLCVLMCTFLFYKCWLLLFVVQFVLFVKKKQHPYIIWRVDISRLQFISRFSVPPTLRSRCRMLLLCMNSIPSHICLINMMHAFSVSMKSSLITRSNNSPPEILQIQMSRDNTYD